jgi:MFS superfamily sulfate permease-like transporter
MVALPLSIAIAIASGAEPAAGLIGTAVGLAQRLSRRNGTDRV